jgi:U3 small nucleolar RNA-associated protein 6
MIKKQFEYIFFELEELLKTNLFTSLELKSYLSQVSRFEHDIQQKAVFKDNFFKYLAFFMMLGELQHRRARIKQENGIKAELANYCIFRRIHYTYERAIRIFRGDTTILFKWLKFCRMNRSHKQMIRAFSWTLQTHICLKAFWSYASYLELSFNRFKKARTLMHNAILGCPSSREIWIDYLRFMATYLNYLKNTYFVVSLKNFKKISIEEHPIVL